MRAQLTTSITKLAPLFQILENEKINVAEFLESAGLDPSIRESPDNRITLEQMFELTYKALELTGDEYIGLRQGKMFTGLSSILGYVMMNCKDFGEAMGKYCIYQKLTDETKRVEMLYEKDTVVLKLDAAFEQYNRDRQLTDYRLAATVSFYKILTGKNLQLNEVRLRYDPPETIFEYEQVFKCPLQFNNSMNALVFSKEQLRTPIKQPNRDLMELFEGHARVILEKFLNIESHCKKTTRLIMDSLKGEVPTINTIAKRMAMSVRNLQLKLKEEGASFRELLDTIRKDLSIEYLKDRSMSITEVSYLLGFSEPSAFHRSFKRWTDSGPAAYRNNMIDSNSQH